MNNSTYLLLLPAIAGILLSSQIAVEMKTRAIFGNFIPVSVVAFGTAFLASLVWAWWTSTNALPSIQQLSETKWYHYLGGIARVTYLVFVTTAAAKFGNGQTCAIVVTAQLLGASFIEHFGFFGVPVFKVNPQRLLGIVFLILGVYCLLCWEKVK
jgi:bacterial/archaeal transporter family-2 protein